MKHRLTGVLLAACCVAASAQNAAIPYKQDASVTATALPGGALGVLLVSALAIVVVLLLRKRLKLQVRGHDGAPYLRVLQTQRLGPRTLLSVVEFGGGQYLIAQGEHGVSCLAAVPGASAPLPAAPGATA